MTFWALSFFRPIASTHFRHLVRSQVASKRCIGTAHEVESTNVSHARFIAEAPTKAKWHDSGHDVEKGGTQATGDDLDSLTEGKGKLSPTSSHLFKLILPLGPLRAQINSTSQNQDRTVPTKPPPPTIFLLHPSQPLSHVARLILASLAPARPSVSFRSRTPNGSTFSWAGSTDVGHFIRDAARASEFEICIGEDATGAVPDGQNVQARISVEVPSFESRTRFLRRRLVVVQEELSKMEALKHQCDIEARRGARRMAMGGLGALVVYWGTVARLTFWDFGWDVMEPVTYLSGLSMVIMGYLWFLYQGREVSYSSVLQRSVSTRREALYEARGFDIEQWLELVGEAKALRKEIDKIAEDYDERLHQEKQEEEASHTQEQTTREEADSLAHEFQGEVDTDKASAAADPEASRDTEAKADGERKL
ncbi:uncharacterized protein LAESUDRAFT_697734 [Laetiporus sulphureus 93-53]|uniref:Calcium uniporter protein, mitochondrial n=1 Tax=Laetiporus sulphureus 93-53 TaxID=1314785 RepID=A0A165F1V5_9APHY|nr:uncharacterized protein LAESUDRAFT_697734 [Laetiporus sulphureus 93-53]KZT08197.1 hypothetical protein LAESUDRAFT_697734 [Laetiporus sulphureus 93-53]